MAGILGNRLNPSPMDMSQFQGGYPGILGAYQQPQVTPVNPADYPKPPNPANGDFWSSYNPDGITQSILGGLFQYDPRKDMGRPENGGNRLATAGAALQDFSQTLSGKPQFADNLQQQLATQIAQQQKQVREGALQKFSAATTPEDRQAAMMQFWASGGDTTGLGAVMKSQSPTFHDIGANGAVIQDPQGNIIGRLSGAPKPPQTRQIQRGLNMVNQQFNDKTGQYEDIPGAVGPRFSPKSAPKAPGAISGFSSPAALFRGQ